MTASTEPKYIVEVDAEGTPIRVLTHRALHTGLSRPVAVLGLLKNDPSMVAYQRDDEPALVRTCHYSWFAFIEEG